MGLTNDFGLIGAQRADHHGDGSITQEFATVAPDVNLGPAQMPSIDAGFIPPTNG